MAGRTSRTRTYFFASAAFFLAAGFAFLAGGFAFAGVAAFATTAIRLAVATLRLARVFFFFATVLPVPLFPFRSRDLLVVIVSVFRAS